MCRMVRLIPLLLLLCLNSCKKYIQYSPNEVRLDESEKNLNEKNIRMLEAAAATDHFKFAVIGDSQRFYEELDDFVEVLNRRNDVAFVILNGDITDFGQNREYKWINDRLKKLKVPYIAVVGNHDMLSNGRTIYKQMFGTENFSFRYGHCKFICINSNSRERGFDGSLPDMNVLRNELSDLSKYTNAFVVSHVPPFHEDFDTKLVQSYSAALSATNKVKLSIHGHDHSYSVRHPYGAGVEYLVTGSISNRSYALISVSNEDYEIEKVAY